jgi:hypothetical protein
VLFGEWWDRQWHSFQDAVIEIDHRYPDGFSGQILLDKLADEPVAVSISQFPTKGKKSWV